MTTTIETPRPSPTVASRRAIAAHATTPLRRPAPHRRPRLPGRHHLPAAHRHPWRLLPTRQLGCASPVTCWQRLRDWQRASVWQQLHHLLVDRGGIPLAVGLSAANTHDFLLLLEPMVDAAPAVKGPRGRPGRPRRRPAKLHGDKGYDYPRCRRALRRRGSTPGSARRGVESSGKLGRTGTWWSDRWRGWGATGGCRRATSGAPTSCSRSCTWPARSSASST
jgi:transposase